jgi:hypothetical protein
MESEQLRVDSAALESVSEKPLKKQTTGNATRRNSKMEAQAIGR